MSRFSKRETKRRLLHKRLAEWKKRHRGCPHRSKITRQNPCELCRGIKELEVKLETVTWGLGTAWRDV